MKKITIAALMAAAVFVTSCQRYEKTKSGMPYKITHGTGKEKFKQGQWVKLNIEFGVPEKDTIFSSTYGHVPAYFPIDTAKFGKYNFTEVILQCAPGDKLEFKLSIDTLKKMGANIEYNKIFKRGGFITGKAEFLQTFPNEEAVAADRNKEMEVEKQREIKEAADYAKAKGLKGEATPSGLIVVVDNEGTGPKADSGKLVSVYYKGYLMKNGKEFDSNMGKTPKAAPLDFVVNRDPMIMAFHEGLKHFAKGGKGKLLIPAGLAYGFQGQPPVIPPFANLVFDIEVADIKDAPPAPTAIPQIMPGHPQVQRGAQPQQRVRPQEAPKGTAPAGHK